MNIFIDESGLFRTAPREDAWCVVAAYVSPEIDRARLSRLVSDLRLEVSGGKEVKLRDLTEARYTRFLAELARLRGIAFAVAMDAFQHSDAQLAHHRDMQAKKVIAHVDKMLHAEGRRGLENLAAAIQGLPVQLYAQLCVQVELCHAVLRLGITYFAQRHPPTLARLRWRVDQKDTIPTAYENAFRMILPALLQTKSLRDPIIQLTGADYSFFQRFEFPKGEAPTFLRDDYGIEIDTDPLDVGKMVREDFRLVDSAAVPGVQVADLLASGLSRTMRGNFDDLESVARLIGANLLQREGGQPPVQLVSLGGTGGDTVTDRSAVLLDAMRRSAKPLLA